MSGMVSTAGIELSLMKTGLSQFSQETDLF